MNKLPLGRLSLQTAPNFYHHLKNVIMERAPWINMCSHFFNVSGEKYSTSIHYVWKDEFQLVDTTDLHQRGKHLLGVDRYKTM